MDYEEYEKHWLNNCTCTYPDKPPAIPGNWGPYCHFHGYGSDWYATPEAQEQETKHMKKVIAEFERRKALRNQEKED